MIDTVLPFALAHVLMGYGMVYVRPSSYWRPIIVFLILVCCHIANSSSVAALVPGAIGHEYIVGFVIHASNFICVHQLHPPAQSTITQKNNFAANQVFNGRWNIAYIPPFCSKDKAYVPSRQSLFLHRLWDLVWTSSIICVLQTYRLNITEEDIVDGPNSILRRLDDVTAREWVIRVYMLIWGNGIPYCSLRAAHSLLSCLSLVCGDTPERWPPLFGSLADAYTVRRYYSHFWHHLMRKAFTSHAVLFVTKVLRLPPKGPATRYLIVTTAFMISALLHILATPRGEMCGAYSHVRFYLSIIGAIFLEDLAISTYLSLANGSKKTPVATTANGKPVGTEEVSKLRESHSNAQALLWKLVGYSWVFMFQTWAVSKLMYGIWYC